MFLHKIVIFVLGMIFQKWLMAGEPAWAIFAVLLPALILALIDEVLRWQNY